jgi:hypothetical protein
MVAQVSYSVAGGSRGLVAPCAVCTVHVETSSVGFLVEPQNQGRRFVSDLASKPLGWFLRFGLKPVATVSWLRLKTRVVEGFPVQASKLAATVW